MPNDRAIKEALDFSEEDLKKALEVGKKNRFNADLPEESYESKVKPASMPDLLKDIEVQKTRPKMKGNLMLMKSGGKVSSASKRGDGCAIKGKTKGRFV